MKLVTEPFGQFKISVESTENKPPFKGMFSTGRNGYYYCFESIHGYSEALARKLAGICDKQASVTATTILPA